jgi:hypothetical protein
MLIRSSAFGPKRRERRMVMKINAWNLVGEHRGPEIAAHASGAGGRYAFSGSSIQRAVVLEEWHWPSSNPDTASSLTKLLLRDAEGNLIGRIFFYDDEPSWGSVREGDSLEDQ